MDRRSFLGRTLAGAAAVTLGGLPLGIASACAPKKETEKAAEQRFILPDRSTVCLLRL